MSILWHNGRCSGPASQMGGLASSFVKSILTAIVPVGFDGHQTFGVGRVYAMSIRHEADKWGTETANVMAPERLEAILQAFEQSAIIVEHRFYRGSRSPDRMVFDDYGVFRQYLTANAVPGDSFWFWRWDELCRDDNALAHGKYPDTDGTVPLGGAY